jgi:ABC-type uncharacterized transport system involved in gliding motility auxiliary subunit
MNPWSSLLGGLGGLALLFSLISFVVQILSGFPLLVDGRPTSGFAWSVGNLVIGAILLGTALFSNLDTLRERMSSGEARRAGKYGTSAIVSSLLMVAILCGLAFLSTRYHTRFDWTEAQSHSLTSQTVKVLEGLDREVHVTALFAAITAQPARALLERYTLASPNVVVEFVDPQGQPGRLAELDVDPDRLEGGVLHVSLGGDSVLVDELTEDALTNAIVKLSRHEQKKVYFLTGHNERPSSGEGSSESEGFAFAAEALTNENYLVDELSLALTRDVPEDADVLIVPGPTRPLHDAERQALRAYLRRGGAMLAMVDPRSKTNLGEDLAEWGVDLGNDVVLDMLQGLFGRPATLTAGAYGSHPITAEFGEAGQDPSLFHYARSVAPGKTAGPAFEVLVESGEQSWGERDLARLEKEGTADQGPDDLAGPVPLAVAGTLSLEEAPAEGDEAPLARLVVFGDSDFASNQLIGEFRNKDLFVNSVNWLLGDVDAISIRPGQPRASRLSLTQEQFMQVRYMALFVLPETIAALGVFAWWWRRRAPGR